MGWYEQDGDGISQTFYGFRAIYGHFKVHKSVEKFFVKTVKYVYVEKYEKFGLFWKKFAKMIFTGWFITNSVDFTKFSSNVRITELFGDLFWKAQCALALDYLNLLSWQNGAKLKNVGLLNLHTNSIWNAKCTMTLDFHAEKEWLA